jgi:hypothetical protein
MWNGKSGFLDQEALAIYYLCLYAVDKINHNMLGA